MKKPYVIVRRHPYEEPHLTQLEIFASNGILTCSTDIYCNVTDLAEIGHALQKFPKVAGEEYQYDYGSEDPTQRCYRYFLLRVYTTDSVGHCALQIAMNQNREEPDEGICRFSIKSEAGSINRLGALFVRFGDLQHLELRWTPDSDDVDLYRQHQVYSELNSSKLLS